MNVIKKDRKISPILTFIILTFIVIVISGILSFFNVQAEYSTVNTITNELTNNVVQVENLFSGEGFRYILTHAVSDFVSFAPLSMLLITLIGIGVLEKTGFLKTVFTLLTKNAKKNTITFCLIFVTLMFSLVGDLGFVITLPLAALLFKYGRRNPLGGIIAAFAASSFGYSINIIMNATDSNLLTMTLNAAKILDPKYTISTLFSLFVMIFALIVFSIIFTNITEKVIMPKLKRYDFEEEELKITNKELKGLIVSLGAGAIYLIMIIYMIIPGLPLSGGLLDNTASLYIDKVFGANSLFNQGFVFIVALFFFILGTFYGLVTKSIKSSKDILDCLSYSLDGVGSIIILIFFASLFISVFKETNIGVVLTGLLSNLISNFNLTGITLIIVLLLVSMISNLFTPSRVLKWSILSGVTVPMFMNASLSPEFAQIVYVAGDSITNGITPLLAYFVIYLAFMEKYNQNEQITLFGSIKYMIPYSIATFIIWFSIILIFYVTGLPLGINSMPGVNYGA